MSASTTADRDRRQRSVLIALALLFFAPLGLAFFLYYGQVSWRPPGHINHGELIDPPRPVPPLSLPLLGGDSGRSTDPDFLRHKWTLLYRGPGACPRRCQLDLYDTRQVRIALNRDMDRVQRVFLAEGACCDLDFLRTEHPDLITVTASANAAPLLALLETLQGAGAAPADRIYLIDPLGNLMMFYGPDTSPKGMLDDLKRLLGLSHVG